MVLAGGSEAEDTRALRDIDRLPTVARDGGNGAVVGLPSVLGEAYISM